MDAVVIPDTGKTESLHKSYHGCLPSQYGKVTMPGELASKKIYSILSQTEGVVCVYAGLGYLSCYKVSSAGLTPYNGTFRFNCLYDD